MRDWITGSDYVGYRLVARSHPAVSGLSRKIPVAGMRRGKSIDPVPLFQLNSLAVESNASPGTI